MCVKMENTSLMTRRRRRKKKKLSVCIVSNIGRWSEFSAWIVFQVVLLYSEDDMVVMSGDVGC